ncbi:hypothetical protein LAZ67_2003825 [Cordylochernes scorpioides]|uniref:Reverse transcriptase domain-containing protein n=1 Tax=Cordylochernes scorpioides TaxID=51811 RepID=A0ABY6K425_9ARAC|nr:hypothetical protein LAZ67_2003825 [Cordylochernes scorpioides]
MTLDNNENILKLTSPQEVKQEITKLSANKAPGHDEITTKLIKNLPIKWVVFLTIIFNASINLCYFPKIWKHAIVIPIPKKQLSKSLDDFRPISLVPIFGKIFERIILKRLQTYIDTRNVLIPQQFGFRENLSTTHQLITVIDFIQTRKSLNEYVGVVLLDLKKAFDMVWHRGLIIKLTSYNFPQNFIRFLKNYLQDRTFSVKVGTYISRLRVITAQSRYWVDSKTLMEDGTLLSCPSHGGLSLLKMCKCFQRVTPIFTWLCNKFFWTLQISTFQRNKQAEDQSNNLEVDGFGLGISFCGSPGRPKSKPWYSRECYLAKKSAKASLTTFKETNTDVDRNIYVSNRKRYTTLINFNKKKYLQEKQELLKNARDSANFWKTIATLKDKSYIQGNITILEWQCFYNKLLSAETTIGSDLSTLSRIDPELYCEISITEITREISSLANEKACGADEIPNEALKTLPFEHLVTLKNIFNRIINSGSYPLIWSKSIIQPIFKSGDRDNPSNYRGIALISNLSKLFTSILKSRLRNWIEGRSIIPENQAGFRKGYSCQDHIFTLLSLIQLTLRRKRRKLYAFFVDLKKAFDTVPHSLLWSKLGELGLDFRFVNLIRNYFEQMTTTVRWNGLFTEPIKIRSGVLQGEPLSPYLFILFVTDLINIFNDSTLPGIYLPNFGTVHLLMYADDIILIGESKINLQIKINMLKKYFETNHLTLNESKSKIMVFRNGGRPAKSDKWFWGDQLLTVTSKYLYLGYPLTTTISFSQVASYFKGKALAATGEVWKIMEKSRLNSFGSSMKLLDSIILSTLLYSAPIWANEKYKILDQIQNNYLRRLLNLPSNTPGYTLRMETGRFSLGVTATKLILKFWLRILKMEKSRLPAICLAQLWETSTLTNAFIGFTENLMNILNSTGFMWLKNCSDPNILQKAIPQIIRITIEKSIQTDQS